MSKEAKPFVIVVPIYEGVDLLDVAPPYEIFCWMGENWPERKVEVYLAAERRDRPLFTRDRFQLTPHKTFDELSHVDMIWAPGGNPPDLAREMANPAFLGFLQRCAHKADWVTSVCGGSARHRNHPGRNGLQPASPGAQPRCGGVAPGIIGASAPGQSAHLRAVRASIALFI